MTDTELQVKMNLIYVLADICDSLLIDVEEELKTRKLAFFKEEKLNFNNFINQVKICRTFAAKMAKPLYKSNEVDIACKDSDYLLDVLLLLIDRIGEDKDREAVIRAAIFNFSSKLNIYK